MGERRFCPSCGEQVETYTVTRSNRTETCCVFCGLGIEAEAPPEIGRAERVLVADDSPAICTLLTDMLLARKLATSVKTASDGAAFLETATRWLREGTPASLVILDVSMPGLEGFSAAAALRAVERAFDVGLPAPILFVTARKIDPAIQAFLKALGPAGYLNKGVAASPDQLASRIEHLVVQLLRPGTPPTVLTEG
ncbi:MAG TPA: response regulator [Thermodesulfobacteriota bacterium]